MSIVVAARAALDRYDWSAAYDLALGASVSEPPDADALEILAEAAWWTSRIDECIAVRERLYRAYEDSGDALRAGATAMELSENYGFRGQPSVARAWLARARRLLVDAPDGLSRGRLLLREAEVAHSTGDVGAAITHGEEALAMARTRRIDDLEAESLQCLARLHIAEGRPEEGLTLFDEAMLIAVEGRCNPFVTGKVYCSFISACEELGDLPRAAEWIEVGCTWAAQHPVSAFPGLCRVHRAEVLQMRGEWARAEAEARRACAELDGVNAYNTALSFREIGEIRRRLGDLEGADAAFRAATDLGLHPQPGLALLRLAEDRVAVAARMIQQALCEVGLNDLARAKLLPAAVQIGVAADDLDAARTAADELERIARVYRSALLEATAVTSRGRLLLAEGDLADATASLRIALQRWRALAVPYEVATTQVLLGEAARRAGRRRRGPGVLHRRVGHVRAVGCGARRRPTGSRPGRGDGPWSPDRARGRAPAPGRRRPHQPRDRGGAVREREDRRAPPVERLPEARRVVTGGSHGPGPAPRTGRRHGVKARSRTR